MTASVSNSLQAEMMAGLKIWGKMVVDTPNVSTKSGKINCSYKTTKVAGWLKSFSAGLLGCWMTEEDRMWCWHSYHLHAEQGTL